MSSDIISHTSVIIPATDHFELDAHRYQSKEQQVISKVLIISSATGVLKAYYKKYAVYAAQQGFTVYTFDYRGIGKSKPNSLKAFEASMHQWGAMDLQGVVNYVTTTHAGVELYMMLHSVGGQIFGLLNHSPLIKKAITVGSQTGYWGNWPGMSKWKRGMEVILLPIITHIIGYFPAKALGMFEDLPKGVAVEWAKWCRSKNYLFDYLPDATGRFAKWTMPLKIYSFSDDDWAPQKASEELESYYSNAQIDRADVTPQQLGVPAIGHFGFFKSSFKKTLWKESIDWLLQ